MVLKFRVRRVGGKRESVSMNASSTVIAFEALIVDAAMAGGRGGWLYKGFAEMRRVVRAGKRIGM